jgi:hypothetical protein
MIFAQRSFRRIIRETDAAAFKKAHEDRPTRQHVVDGLGNGVVARELDAFGAHPLFKRCD